ncbi:hypothetical protein M5K25_009355 [Dendrobium thyrsiflorum]|uniref:Uncharacterized protein n=1 Tax=Dendrobium thyrsiflorum TaxID=117978 RepID=A0ABD0V5B8_DENTH
MDAKVLECNHDVESSLAINKTRASSLRCFQSKCRDFRSDRKQKGNVVERLVAAKANSNKGAEAATCAKLYFTRSNEAEQQKTK